MKSLIYKLITFNFIIFNSVPSYGQMETYLSRYFNIVSYNSISLSDSLNWQIRCRQKYRGVSILTRKGNELIDSSIFDSYKDRVGYHVNSYTIKDTLIIPIIYTHYTNIDSMERVITNRQIFDSNGKLTSMITFCNYYYLCSGFKVESYTYRKRGKYIYEIKDSNGIVRIRGKGTSMQQAPSKLKFFDINGKLEFTGFFTNDSSFNKYKNSMCLGKDNDRILGEHSYFIVKYALNYGRFCNYIKSKKGYYMVNCNK